MARLLGRTGAVAGQDFVLSDSMRLGAAGENDIRISARGVSRWHARVFLEAGKFWVEDTGATNGTFVNGSRVQRETLRHLDVITLGRRVDLIFLSREDEPPPAPEVDQLIDVKLEILDGAEAGKAVDVPRGEIIMGRAASCNVVLNSSAVGRAHARIERTAKRLLIQDLRSANGTFVNGERMNGTAPLASGDVIRLGGVRSVRVRIKGSPSPPPAIAESPLPHSRPINPEWRTRFTWGPEELAQIEAGRADAIARAKLLEPREVPPQAMEAPAERVAAAGPVALAHGPAASAPAPAAPFAEANAPRAEVPSLAPVDVPNPPKSAATPSSRAEPQPARTSEIGAAPVASSPQAPAETPDRPIQEAPIAPVVAVSPAARSIDPPVVKPTASPAAVVKPVALVDPSTRLPIGVLQLRGITLIGPDGPIRLGLGTFKIGRAMDADVRLEDRQVSRAHATLVVDETSATVEDLKTVNGTLVNGQEIKGRETIRTGDTLRFGDSVLTVELVIEVDVRLS